MYIVKEWSKFLSKEENSTFAIQQKGGCYAKHYLPYKRFMELLKSYPEWLNAIPCEVWYNNNHEGGTLFVVDIPKTDEI